MNAALAQSYSSDQTERRPPHKAEDAYRTISEVADELNVAQHVLRFWESKFKPIEPMKRAGGRRYYRREDVDLLKRIHFLLYSQGYTIKGVQKLLAKDRHLLQAVPAMAPVGASVSLDSLSPGLRPPVAPANLYDAPAQPDSQDDGATEQLSLFNASDRVMMIDVLRRLKGLQSLLND
ncbi:MAG TPA: MerR family transcriptional regulator [Alphaproteobacteria bacterium]